MTEIELQFIKGKKKKSQPYSRWQAQPKTNRDWIRKKGSGKPNPKLHNDQAWSDDTLINSTVLEISTKAEGISKVSWAMQKKMVLDR